ncbi:MAG: metallophosphoesterase [Archangiaceae bacterium]|nr:metallophosphoesterase [Archangiaceae bacterium]
MNRPLIATGLLCFCACPNPGEVVDPPDDLCTLLNTAVVRYESPASGDSVYAISAEDVTAARAAGYTLEKGTAFRASLKASQGLAQVERLYNDSDHDHVFTTDAALKTRLTGDGYVAQSATPFYVATDASSCAVRVISLIETAKVKHRLTTADSERDGLLAEGWQDEGVAFYARAGDGYTPPVVPDGGGEQPDASVDEPDAGPFVDSGTPDAGTTDAGRPDSGTPDAGKADAGVSVPDAGPRDAGARDAGPLDTKFMLVVMPDTQREVNSAAKAPRFANRMQWVKDNRAALDIRFVMQVGDLNDWDTADHIMYERTSAGLAILDDAGVPYALVPGNHDTNAVGIGGSACTPTGTPSCPTVPLALRITDTFNHYYPVSRFPRLGGTYEPSKIDNAWHTFSAGGYDFLVLALELWPRTAVVSWAKTVVASHPHHNVIYITHSHLNSSSAIEQTNGGYGANSPQYVFDNLLKLYPNVLFTMSGHVGTHGYKVDTGVNGNKIYNFLQCYHDEVTNPSRLLEIDTASGTVTSKVYGPFDNSTKSDGSSFTVTGVQFVH